MFEEPIFFDTRPLITYKDNPPYIASGLNFNLINIPMYAFMGNYTTLSDIEYLELFVQVKNPKDHETIDAIASEFGTKVPSGSVTVAYKEQEKTADIDKILTKVFVSVIAITMFLCFFSLSASMSTNLYEQKKEIGVLRSMGFTKYRIKALYFYEALLLVFSSCVLGVLIGCCVGWTMLLQQNLFLGLHLGFVFPWKEFILIFSLSILCAWISTYGPATSLTNKKIAAIFRLV